VTLVGDHRRRRPSALTAASAPAVVERGTIRMPTLMLADDEKLWSFYRTLAEVHNPMQFKRDAAIRARFLPAQLSEPGNDPEPTDDPGALEAFEVLDGGRGRIAEAVGDCVVHLDVTGIGWPVYQVRQKAGGPDEDQLVVYGTQEVKRATQGRLELVTENGTRRADLWQVDQAKGDLVATIWRPSPHNRRQPDSPLRAVANECEELLALSRQVRAAAWSQLHAGILVVPEETRMPPPLAPPQPGQLPKDPFVEDMMRGLTAPISDHASTASVQPYVMFVPGEFSDRVRWIDIGRRTTPEDLALREELRTRIVIGVNLPPEMIEGLGGSKYWNAQLIDATAYRQHFDPVVLLVLDGLTRQIFQPLLRQRRVADPERFVLWRDISELTTSPNRVGDAVLLFDRGIIGAPPVRRVAGYDETDKPGGDESPGPVGPVAEPEAPPRGGPPAAPPSPGPAVAAGMKFSEFQRTDSRALARAGTRLADIDSGLLLRLTSASRDASNRALDRAGARLRNRARSDRNLTAVLEGAENREVGLRLGRGVVVDRLQVSEQDLVTEADFADLREDATRRLDRAVEQAAVEAAALGTEPVRNAGEERSAVDRAAELLVAALLAATVARLFTAGPEADPAETGEVGEAGAPPGRVVLDTMTVAGGGAVGAVPSGPGYEAGVGNGPRSVGWLRAGGVVTAAYRWRYGDRSARATNFEPHLVLDAIEFDRWDDPTLRVVGAFPRGPGYHPGDHKGCLCGFERVLWRT